jgi:asparagine synthase (glutamine-hydrolysing)
MCGLAGLMTADGSPVPAAVLDHLAGAMAHRGPDGTGRVIENDVGLVHTRLAIIDLHTGDQPIRFAGESPVGTPVLIANAEIYNYVELRRDMDDVAFATKSDCEPPLHLYRRHGLDFADHLRGMYAIVIYDPALGRLVLARDPFGIKPLYVAETAAGFAFASEPRALIAAGLVEPVLRADKRDELLQLQFTTGRETPFAGIERLLPGETVAVEGGRIVDRRRRAALPVEGPRSVDADTALDRLDVILEDSVTVHQRSDVPYGMFLSGGIDSSVVLSLMARLNERPVRAFTVGFPGTEAADERDQARAAAAAVGADHVEVEFVEADFWSLLPAVAAATSWPRRHASMT